MDNQIDTSVVETLVKLLITHKLDRLKVGDIEIIKSKHESFKQVESVPESISNKGFSMEDLFYSSPNPHLTQEAINQIIDSSNIGKK